MKRGIVFVVGTGMVVLLAAGISAAHFTSAPTTVEDFTAEKFAGDPNAGVEINGRIASRNKCRAGRTVVAFHDVPPKGPSPNDFELGEDITDAQGKFGIFPPANLRPDKVYVIVTKRVKKKRGHRHKCKRAVSKTVPVKSYK